MAITYPKCSIFPPSSFENNIRFGLQIENFNDNNYFYTIFFGKSRTSFPESPDFPGDSFFAERNPILQTAALHNGSIQTRLEGASISHLGPLKVSRHKALKRKDRGVPYWNIWFSIKWKSYKNISHRTQEAPNHYLLTNRVYVVINNLINRQEENLTGGGGIPPKTLPLS